MESVLSPLGIVTPPFYPLFVPNKWRYKVYYGGRGSGKSKNTARAVAFICDVVKLDVMYAREFQVSIADSSYKDLANEIKELGLSANYELLKTEIRNLKTGSLIRFKGLSHQDGQGIKSYSGLDLVVIEEAATISESSWLNLDPTIRKNNSEIWVLFNPQSEDDFVYKKFVIGPPSNAHVRKINFDENPYFPEVLETQRQSDQISIPKLYPWIWLGELRAIGEAVVPLSTLLVNDQPVIPAQYPVMVYAVIDTAIKSGSQHDGTAAVYFAYYRHVLPDYFEGKESGIVIMDYDKVQIDGAWLENWLPNVVSRLGELAGELSVVAMNGAGYSVFIEDKASGTMLLQKAQASEYRELVQPIDSRLTAQGKEVGMTNALPFLTGGRVKISNSAYRKQISFKGETRNHFLKEFIGFRYGVNNQADDLADCGRYGIALALDKSTS